MGGTFASLENPHFRVLWAGTFFAFIAFFMATAVQSVVAFDLSGNNRAVGFVIFAQGIAQMVLGPFGGALADRMSKKFLISACQLVITFSFRLNGNGRELDSSRPNVVAPEQAQDELSRWCRCRRPCRSRRRSRRTCR
jgi:nitrate/nitrite transporter NarK